MSAPIPIDPARAEGSRLAPLLGAAFGWASVVCLALMPTVMAVAHRSTPLMIVIAALFALAAAAADRELGDLWHDASRALMRPLALAALVFLGWALVTAAWSPNPRASLFAWGEFVLPLVAGLVTALVLPHQMGRLPTYLLAAGLALGSLVILADLATGMVYRGMLGMRVAAFVLNRPALVLLALLPVALWLLWRENRPILAAALALVVAAAILRTESGAAKLGLAASAGGAALALISRRLAATLLGLALAATFVLAPVLGDMADRVLPPQLVAALSRAHAQDRIDIWRAFGAVLAERPLAGYGFDATPRLPPPEGLAPDFATLLAVGHPHDAALQIWVETGAVGCFLAAIVAAFLVAAMPRMSRGPCAVAAAMLSGALAVSLVGQGAWQGWWPAALAAALTWLAYGRCRHDHYRKTGFA